MSSKSKAEGTSAIEPEDSITISKTEFEALIADMKLMKQQLVSEERQKSISDKKREREEALVAQTEAANAAAEEEVDCYVDLGSLRSNKNIEVSINGRQYIIPRGKHVRIPRKVKEVVENALKQRAVAFGIQDAKKADFEKAEATGQLTL